MARNFDENTGANTTTKATHKLVIETSEGNCTVLLYSNNKFHKTLISLQDEVDFMAMFADITTSIEVVPNAEAEVDKGTVNNLKSKYAKKTA